MISLEIRISLSIWMYVYQINHTFPILRPWFINTGLIVLRTRNYLILLFEANSGEETLAQLLEHNERSIGGGCPGPVVEKRSFGEALSNYQSHHFDFYRTTFRSITHSSKSIPKQVIPK